MNCTVNKTLSVRRNRNLAKMMDRESKNENNIQIARPQMDLRSTAKVRMKQKFTTLTNRLRQPRKSGPD